MKTVALIGFGLIGKYIYKRSIEEKTFTVHAIMDSDKSLLTSLPSDCICESLSDITKLSVDVVVESAHAEVAKMVWPLLPPDADFFPISLTCFADKNFYEMVKKKAVQTGRKVYIPHGAILALDGLFDGRKILESVTITTTKHPKNLGLNTENFTEPQVIFDGTTRHACVKFPRNVNVHAAIALSGLGFDKTKTKVIADPNTSKMSHIVEVTGSGINWRFDIQSTATGAVTGSYTPESVYQSLKRVCQTQGGLTLP